MKKSQIKLKIFISVFAVISIFLLVLFFCIISSNETIRIDMSFSETGLTSKQKREDYDYLCNVIEKSLPTLYEYEALGYDYKEQRDLYRKKIAECDSDYEFYGLILAFMNNIPSVHTNLSFPDMKFYNNLVGYNYANYFRIHDNIEEVTNYWNGIIGSNVTNLNDLKTLCFNYSNGRYTINKIASTIATDYDIYNITSVNGTEINEFVRNSVSSYKIKYDSIRGLAYRDVIIFNDRAGEKYNLSITDTDGISHEIELFGNIETEQAIAYGEYYNNTQSKDDEFTSEENNDLLEFVRNEIDCEGFYAFRDISNDTAYFEIVNFNNADGRNLRDALKNTIDLNNVIIDLRWNSGGYDSFYQTYIYPELFIEGMNSKNVMYFVKNKHTDYIFDVGKYTEGYYIEKEKEVPFDSGRKSFYSLVKETEFIGNAEKARNIYILIGSDTASASDSAAGFIKDNKLGVLIGSDTAGEGKTGSFMIDNLPNSGLIFTYTFCKGINSDGTDNSVYGTAPDIYSEVTESNNELMKQIKLKGNKAYTYENRLLWDDVLIKALEIINEE